MPRAAARSWCEYILGNKSVVSDEKKKSLRKTNSITTSSSCEKKDADKCSSSMSDWGLGGMQVVKQSRTEQGKGAEPRRAKRAETLQE